MAKNPNAECLTGKRAMRPVLVAASLVAFALLASLAGGCADGPGAIVLESPAEFQRVAVQSPKPALVMFYKGGCASCAALEPTMDELAKEYQDRAVVAKFMIITFVFEVTSQDLKDKYGVSMVPHVVLLVDGKEKNHWIMEYNIDTYRKALNAVVGPATTPARPAGSPPPARPAGSSAPK